MPHFLTHGKTVFLEWGWVYDKQPFGSDVFLETDTFGNRYIKADVFKSPVKKVVDKNGDLDMMTGIIKILNLPQEKMGLSIVKLLSQVSV